MASRLTSAMEEAYASAPSSVLILHTLELSHPTLATPIRIVTGDEGPPGGETLLMGLETGGIVSFTALAFDVIPPGFDDDGPTPGKIRIDGASDLIFPLLENAAVAAGTIGVTYRSYRSDAYFQPGDVISGLKMRQMTLTATAAEGEVAFAEVGEQAFPRAVYTIDKFPGLFVGS